MPDELSSRERLLRCFRHQEIDRTPATIYEIDPWDPSTYQSQHPTYLQYVEIARQYDDTFLPVGFGNEGIYWSASDEVSARSETQVEGSTHYLTHILETPKGTLTARYRRDEGVATSWELEPLLKSKEDEAKFLSMPFVPPKLDFSEYYRKAQAVGERGVLRPGLSDPICVIYPAMRWERFSQAAMERPRDVLRLLEFVAERLEWYVREIAQHCHETVFRICGPEYLGPPLASPKLFRDFCLAFDRRLVEIIRSTDNFACIHCHGRLGAILDMIAEMEPHLLEPLEPPPDGDVTLKELKRRVGSDICLMGYIEFRHLEYDEPRVLEQRIAEACRDGGETGYVLLPTAGPIQALTERSLNNHRLFFEAARKYGRQ